MQGQLPGIDVHSININAPVEACWANLTSSLEGLLAGPLAAVIATALGCRERRAAGPAGSVGSTVPGFRIAHSEPPSRLTLRGAHRYSEYELEFRLEPAGEGRSRLHAESRASFPGLAGALYRSLVIGTGGHVVAVRAMLRRIRRATETSNAAQRA